MSTVRSRAVGVAPPLVAPRPRPELRVVDPDELSPAARRRRARVLAGAVAVVVVASLFGVTVFHTVLVADQGDIDALHGRVAEQQARYERLRLEVAQLESPERIVQEARERLGMVPAAGVVYLTPSPAVAEEILGGERPPVSGDDRAAADGWPAVKPYLGGG